MLLRAAPRPFAAWSPAPARALLLLTTLATALCLAVALTCTTLPSTDRSGDQEGDVALYRRVAERVRAGESYYPVLGEELRTRGFPTGSVFNWRLPTYAWALAAAPTPETAKLPLAVVAMAVLFLAWPVLRPESGILPRLGASCCLATALGWAWLAELYLFAEVWAMVFIALSVYGTAAGWRRLGVAAGVAALFFRELALPYCFLGLVLALGERRWREATAWCLGLAAWGAFLGWHAHEVLGRIGPDDPVHAHGWIRLGGLPFVLGTAQFNPLLFLLPSAVTAVLFPLALVGAASWRPTGGPRLALTLVGYLAAFAVVGNPEFNCYWGFLYAPLFAGGLACAPAALASLFRAARGLAEVG